MKYQFIEAQRIHYPVRRLCRVLGVAASGYYAACAREPSARARRQAQLSARIQAIHTQSRATYGSPRIHAELIARGERCCRNTVAKLMRRAGIVPKTVRRFRVTTDSRHTLAAPNLLGRVFSAAQPNNCWLTDVTFVPTRQGWLYLAVILDLYSRSVVGWSMGQRLDRALAIDALTMALDRRGAAPTILHSDRGSIYCVADYRALLARHGIRQSMSRKADCWDNAPMESFFNSMKNERTHGERYATRDEARQDTFEYIEAFYNRSRRHSALGYVSPAQHYAAWQSQQKMAA